MDEATRRAAEQQIERLKRQHEQRIVTKLQAMDAALFGAVVAALFERVGYNVAAIDDTAEGFDLVLTQRGYTVLAQGTRLGAAVGQSIVSDLYDAMERRGAGEAYLITTAQITPQARAWAADKPLHLIDGRTLAGWIKSAPRRSREQPPASEARRRPFGLLAAVVLLAAITLCVAAVLAGPQISQRLGIALWPRSTRWAPPTPTVVPPTAAEPATSTPTASPMAPLLPTALPTPTATATPTVPAVVPPTVEPSPTASPTALPAATATPTASDTPTATDLPSSTPTAAATPTSTPLAELPCFIPVSGSLVDLYERPLLGCAATEASIVWAAWQPFERGNMLWRSDTNAADVLYGLGSGVWEEIADAWDGSPYGDRGNPPPGLHAPARGFGYIWTQRDSIFQGLGWAIDQEKGFCALVQGFDGGFLLRSSDVEACTPDGLFNHARQPGWRPTALIVHGSGWSER